MSRDSKYFVDGPNMYAYGRNDPNDLSDPFGTSCSDMLLDYFLGGASNDGSYTTYNSDGSTTVHNADGTSVTMGPMTPVSYQDPDTGQWYDWNTDLPIIDDIFGLGGNSSTNSGTTLANATGKTTTPGQLTTGVNLNLIDNPEDNKRVNSGDVYTISAHGLQRAIYDSQGNLIIPSQLANALLNNPDLGYVRGTPIELDACYTASTLLGPTNFASELSRILGVSVTAPTTVMWISTSTGDISVIADILVGPDNKPILDANGKQQPDPNKTGTLVTYKNGVKQ